MHRRFQQILMAAIAGSVLAPAELRAGSVSGQIGAASRATIGIRVSVAPRMGVYTRTSVRPEGEVAVNSVCVWSSSPSRNFIATLQDQATGHDLTSGIAEETRVIPLESGKSLETTAQPSAIACRSADHHNDIQLGDARKPINEAGRPRGKAVLILAPE